MTPATNLCRNRLSAERIQKSHAKALARPHHRPVPVMLDPIRFRATFGDGWARFVRAEFRSIEAVAAHYGVTFQTACNWWAGTHRPSGPFVAMACLERPQAFRVAMGVAA